MSPRRRATYEREALVRSKSVCSECTPRSQSERCDVVVIRGWDCRYFHRDELCQRQLSVIVIDQAA